MQIPRVRSGTFWCARLTVCLHVSQAPLVMPQSHKLSFFRYLTCLSDESNSTRTICREVIPLYGKILCSCVATIWERLPMPHGTFRYH